MAEQAHTHPLRRQPNSR